MASDVRQGSNPDFCPPVEEGITLTFQDDNGDLVELEFLGLVIMGSETFGFFFPVDDENPALSSGEVVILEVTEFDEDGIPLEFELVDDESTAVAAYDKFKEATKEIYRFE